MLKQARLMFLRGAGGAASLSIAVGISALISVAASLSLAASGDLVRGMNLTEIGEYVYDAAPEGMPKLPAQEQIDRLKAIGVRHIVLNPRATMTDPRGTDVLPMVPAAGRANERARYKRLIDYIHAQGLTVGLRPIFFVTRPDGSFPYIETLPDGSKILWWHGNIQPREPDAWFASFKNYLDIYLLIAKVNRVEEFTIGAELYSMTVGIEDQWKAYPYGFPGRWLALLRYARAKLGAGTRIMYDVNFTDQSNDSSGQVGASGGELERWRYRLVDLANPRDPAEAVIWRDLADFWKELDAVGIDFYRSLASKQNKIPSQYDDLVRHLTTYAERYATQLDSTLTEIDATIGSTSKAILKEVGYRSVTNGFIEPFHYVRPGDAVNIPHQAAAYEAVFRAFWAPMFPWAAGIVFWDSSVNPLLSGPMDTGFNPLGKEQTENVIRSYYQ